MDAAVNLRPDQLIETALEFASRAATDSTVTLNLTYFWIAVGIKIVLIGLVMYNYSASQGGLGRSMSMQDDAAVKGSELVGGMCFVLFASGAKDKLSCLQRAACEDPVTASSYLAAAKVWIGVNELFGERSFDEAYSEAMRAMEDAVAGGGGEDCARFKW